MNFIKKVLLLAIASCYPVTISAQYISIDENYTPQQLVQDVLVNNSCATISNVTFSGHDFGNGNSLGYFSAGTSSFPFAEGVILTTGRAASAVGPNSSILSEGPTNWQGDSDLEQALGVNNSINATVLEFDFLPLANKISFDYIFSSEQYLSSPSSNQCNYTDGFTFLLKEVNSTGPYQNLAVIPNTTTPVKVNTVRGSGTVCPAANEEYFDAFNDFEHPTNYNGQTIIMTAQATVIPNTLYHIKLVVADQGNNLYDSAIFLGGGSFKVEKNLGPDRLLATNNPACFGETVSLNATEPGNNTYQWFENNTAIPGETNATYTITDSGIYSVTITLNGSSCSATGKISIEYADLPVLNNPTTFVQCDTDTDGISVFNLTQIDNLITLGNTQLSGVTYYESLAAAQNQTNPILNPAAYQNTTTNQLIARVTNGYGCAAFATVNLAISNQVMASQNPVSICDSDGTSDGLTVFNLNQLVTPQILLGLPSGLMVEYYASENNAISQTNELPNLFNTTIPNQQQIFARIVNGSDCFGITPVTLVVNGFNPPNFADEILFLCSGFSKTLQVASGFSDYLWSNGTTSFSTIITTSGIYSVTVTDANGCQATKNYTILDSGIATFISADINDFSGNQNSVLINFTGTGVYQFSLDGTYFQDSPYFSGIAPGEYFVYIKDKNGCGPIDPVSIYVLDYPRFFTPNGDGNNDNWSIPFLVNQPKSIVTIYDRYGKTLYSFKGNGSGWDGTMNSKALPSSDYWFVLQLENGRIIKGHFSLKR